MKTLRVISMLAGLAVVGLTSGCAFSRTPVQVNFKPVYQQPLQAAAQPGLNIGEFKDSRPVNDPTFLMHKANAYGPTSGAWVAQKPVGQLLRDGVEEALRANQFKLDAATASKYELRGDLQEFGFNSIAGVWTAKVKPRMQVRFELFEKASGTSVWRDTFLGRGEMETAWGTSETIITLFKLGAEDIVRQLISDPTFRKISEGGKAPSQSNP